jgi:hypothetical protein
MFFLQYSARCGVFPSGVKEAGEVRRGMKDKPKTWAEALREQVATIPILPLQEADVIRAHGMGVRL